LPVGSHVRNGIVQRNNGAIFNRFSNPETISTPRLFNDRYER
jgi:hypothetical protein